jgi:hypothetical protein
MVFNKQLQVKKKEKENCRLATLYYFVKKLRNSIILQYIFIGYPSWSTSTIGLYIRICYRKKIKYIYKREFYQYNVYVKKKKISFSFPQKTPKRKVHKAPYSILDFYLQKLVLLALCTFCMCLSVV